MKSLTFLRREFGKVIFKDDDGEHYCITEQLLQQCLPDEGVLPAERPTERQWQERRVQRARRKD